jgi:acetamidase/formamidase
MQNWSLKDQSRFPLKYVMSPYNEPRITVKPGEKIAIEVNDAFSGHLQQHGEKPNMEKFPYANPVTGPIYVEGAEKDDTLTVDIHEIQPLTGKALTVIGNFWWYFNRPQAPAAFNEFTGLQFPDEAHIMPIRDGKVHFNDRIAMPFEPDIGSIGTAPEVESILTTLPGPHGGNMDFPEMTVGSRAYFPVNVPGALLHLCDTHARRGDMTVHGCSILMQAKVTVTLNLLKGKKLNWPRIETPTHIMTMACSSSGVTLEEAMRIAYVELVLWLMEYGFPKWDAYKLTSLATVRVGNPWMVGAKFPKEYLDKART